jgi:hypothetical protein
MIRPLPHAHRLDPADDQIRMEHTHTRVHHGSMILISNTTVMVGSELWGLNTTSLQWEGRT